MTKLVLTIESKTHNPVLDKKIIIYILHFTIHIPPSSKGTNLIIYYC